MKLQTKLLIIPGLKDSHDLGQRIHDILRDDFEMGNGVEILIPLERSEVPDDARNNHRSPLVIDFFPDMEVQVDGGRNVLKDVIRGKHAAIVQHLYNPTSKGSVNDRFVTVLGMLDVLNEAEVLHRTLVEPYPVYLRSHSIEKYKGRGFIQFDSLLRLHAIYAKMGLNTLIGLDPHSKKIKEVAAGLGMTFRDINPFQSARSIDPAKLGLTNPGKAEEVKANLRPYQELFTKVQSEDKKVYFVSVDDGTEPRVCNFTERAYRDLDDPYVMMAYLGKDREGYSSSFAFFKSFSRINEKNIDPEGIYVLIDDLFASGGTTDKVASRLKELGAKRVEVWVSHVVTSPEQVQKAKELTSIDQVVGLATVHQDPSLGVVYLEAAPHLLAAELYKEHQTFLSNR